MSGEAPTVSFIPIHPLKSFRSGGEFKAKPVTKLVLGSCLVKFAV